MSNENGLIAHLRAMHTATQQAESKAETVRWTDLRRLLSFLRGRWWRVMGAIITMLTASLLSMPGPLLIRYIAHRLSTILALAVDRVFEVAEGRLIEVGLPRPNQAVNALPLVYGDRGVPTQAAE